MNRMIKIAITALHKTITTATILQEADVEPALEAVRTTALQMLAADLVQRAYQRQYDIADNEIVPDFNGDGLYMATGIRMVEYEDLADVVGCAAGFLHAMEAGTVQPSQRHLTALATALHFPVAFFTQAHQRETDHIFMCKMPDWAG